MGSLQGMENEMKKFRDFEEAREFARSLNFKNGGEWREYCKSGNKPNDIPNAPAHTYKNKGWISFGDWLDSSFWSFNDAREYVQKLNLVGTKEWREFRKSKDRPHQIPSNPDYVYKNKGWISFGDWFGTFYIADQFHPPFRPYKEAREFAKSLGLKSDRQWKEYCKSGNKPDDIPANPRKFYKKDFKSMGDWLGTEWRDFESAREFTRSLKLKNTKEWLEYCKSGNKPDDIPTNPWIIYKEWNKK